MLTDEYKRRTAAVVALDGENTWERTRIEAVRPASDPEGHLHESTKLRLCRVADSNTLSVCAIRD